MGEKSYNVAVEKPGLGVHHIEQNQAYSCMTSSKLLSMLRLSHLVYEININDNPNFYKFAVKIKF